MTCNCVRDNEARIANHYSERLGTQAEASAKNIAFTLDGGERAFIVYTVRADKTGWKKGKDTNMFFNFCPFCGEKTAEAK
jgi:hypothetical protein